MAKAVDCSPVWLLFGIDEIEQLTEEGLRVALAWQELPEDQRESFAKLILSSK